ncbi:hypothetical protein N431DRAFT_477694 [Stipitochalara longipes BDJ]|nr:hypothetical protein N431DRAFT_477694 [Stipitochalara longipes BDJ]
MAQVHIIGVGAGVPGHSAVFSPQTLTANPGDTVQFQFKSGNHTASQGIFGFPCLQNGTGFFSGFMPTSSNSPTIPTYSINIPDLTPIYFFSAQGSECQEGQVGGINTPSEGNTLALYQVSAEQLGPYAVSTAQSGQTGGLPVSTGSAGSSPKQTSSTPTQTQTSQITSSAGSATTPSPGTGKATVSISAGATAAIVIGVFALLGIGAAIGICWRRKTFFWGGNEGNGIKHMDLRSREEKEAALELDGSDRPGIGARFGRHELPAR